MAEESAAERTEDATPRKRQQAHERGNVARSRDLSASVVLFAAVLFLRYGGAWLALGLEKITGRMICDVGRLPIPDGNELLRYVPAWLAAFAGVMAPMLLFLLVVAWVAGVAQVGFVMSAEPLALKFERLDPVEGLKRMFNLRSLVTLGMSFGKLLLVGAVGWLAFASEFASLVGMVGLSSGEISLHLTQSSQSLMLKLASALLVLSLLDMWYQRFQWERDLRMTKQEMREELRDTDGDPHIKSRRRAIQRRMAQQRMMAEVPKAEVVVRNPTHYAVALAFDPDRDKAPYIVAKGVDRIALRIIKIAIENRVPVKYQPELARALCKLELGDAVPQDLWQAVIEVLAWVYKGDRKGRLAKMRAS